MATGPHVTDDYRCSECGGRVGATSRHCMHCEADFGPRDDYDGSGEGGDEPSDAERLMAAFTGGEHPGAPSPPPADERSGTGHGQPSEDAVRLQAALTKGHPSHSSGDERLGTEIGTSAVGVLAGVVLGPAAFLSTITLGWVAFPVGFVAWAAGTFLVAREEALRDAVGLAMQLLALPVLFFPVSLALPTLTEQLLSGSFDAAVDNLLGAAVAELFFAVVWVPLLVLGRWLHR
ncbi:hypothetical protein [Haloarchaeobius sp. DT45]|uniref:hypothetical protein n=1 Tax=Haloarchaeobius sp. DT45 TaxID=3446116 RepID=UPI003F6AECD7